MLSRVTKAQTVVALLEFCAKKSFNRWVTIGLTDLTSHSTSWHTSALTFIVDFCPLDEFLKFGDRIVRFKRRGDILNVWFLYGQTHSLVCWCAVLSRFSHVRLFGTLWTAGLLCPWEFFRQEYWSGLPFPPPQGIPDPGARPHLSRLLHRQVCSLRLEPPGKAVGFLHPRTACL